MPRVTESICISIEDYRSFPPPGNRWDRCQRWRQSFNSHDDAIKTIMRWIRHDRCLPADVGERGSCPFSTAEPRLAAQHAHSNAPKELRSHIDVSSHYRGVCSFVYRRLLVWMRLFFFFCFFFCLFFLLVFMFYSLFTLPACEFNLQPNLLTLVGRLHPHRVLWRKSLFLFIYFIYFGLISNNEKYFI